MNRTSHIGGSRRRKKHSKTRCKTRCKHRRSRHHRSRHHKSRHHKSRHHKSRHHKKHRRHHRVRHHRTKKRQRGGSNFTPGAFNLDFTPTWRTRNTLTPAPLLNLARSATTGVENIWNGLQGITAVESPLPGVQKSLDISRPQMLPANISAANINAQQQVKTQLNSPPS